VSACGQSGALTPFVEPVAVDLGEAAVGDLTLELRDLGDVPLEVGAGEPDALVFAVGADGPGKAKG